MRKQKYTLGDHPKITCDGPYEQNSTRFFGRAGKFPKTNPDNDDRVKEIRKEDGRIVANEESTCYYITVSEIPPDILLNKIELILNNHIGIFVKDIADIEID